ncbi:RNA polymerase sigma factor SigE [Pseudonocardia sp. CA-107938]|uniref:RNA polymerase sigma factor SigE n=1 Tax=Pseudonocardia sp. CA-107938 TaxID=3240021 RepID=UPI003D94D149
MGEGYCGHGDRPTSQVPLRRLSPLFHRGGAPYAVSVGVVGRRTGGNTGAPAVVTHAGTTRRRRIETAMTTTVLPGEGAEWAPPSWDDIVRDHADRVYRLAYRLTGNPHDAEDLTQETFVRVFRSLASYKPGTFEGWLHRITTNLFLDMVRRRARIRMEALPEDSDRIAGAGPEPEQVFSDTHLDPDLQAALDELPPEFRAAVVLCDVEGLSYEEIGATLGVKLGTVRSRIHRGRAALRSAIERQRALRDETAATRVLEEVGA